MTTTGNPRTTDPDALPLTSEAQAAALTRILEGVRQSPTACLPTGDDTYILGVILAHYVDYLGSDIMAVAQTALECAGLYGTARRVETIRCELEAGQTS